MPNSNRHGRDFSSGPVVKTPPSKAGSMGLIPSGGTKVPHAMEYSKTIKQTLDFPSGPVLKNLPANSRDMGLIPGPGRFHMLRDI